MYKRVLLFAASIGLILGIVWTVGLQETFDAMTSISPQYLFLLLVIQTLTMVSSALKWRVILRHTKVSFSNLMFVTFVGYLVNNVTPIGMMGGEPVKAYLLAKKEGIETEKSFASVLVDLFLEIIPLFFLSALAIFFIISYGISLEIAAVIALASLVLLIFFTVSVTLVVNQTWSFRITGFFVRLLANIPFMKRRAEGIRSQVNDICGRFNESVRKQMLDRFTLVTGTAISTLGWVLRIMRVYVIFLALGIELPLSVLIIVEAVAIVVTFVPISPGALGVWEGTSIALFMLLGGVTAVTATTAALIDRLIFYLYPSITGVLSAIYLRVDVLRLVEKEMTEDKVDLENVSKVVGN